MNHPNSSFNTGFAKVGLSSLLTIGMLYVGMPAFAQLPPVNMGRWVKQPGDNQYSNDTQQQRHGGGQPKFQVVPQQTAVMPQQSAPAWRPTPRPNRPDISLDPIVCDEPIAPVGFAPLPESLDLPGLRGSSGFTSSRGGMSVGGGGGGGGASFSSSYQGSAPGLGNGSAAGGPPMVTHSSGGYNNVAPGAFVPKKTPYGPASTSMPAGGGDVYSSGDGAGAPQSDAQRAMNRLGPEPRLNNKPGGAPEAPAAVQVNQGSSQDLSLPDDEYKQSSSRKSTSQAGKILTRTMRRAGQSIVQPLNNLPMPRFPMR